MVQAHDMALECYRQMTEIYGAGHPSVPRKERRAKVCNAAVEFRVNEHK